MSSNDKNTQKKKIKNHHHHHNRFGNNAGGVFCYCRNQRLLFVSFVVLSTILHLIIHNFVIDDLTTAKSKADVDVDLVVVNVDVGINNGDIKIDNDDENNNIQRQLIKNNMTTTSPTSLYHNNNVNNNTTSFPSPSSAAAAAAASQQQQQKQTSDATVTATAATKTVWLNDHLHHHLWNNISNPSSSSTSIGLLVVEIPSSYKPPKGINRICSTWNISIDDWWVHNYRWKIVKETTTEYCLEQWLHQAQTTTTATTTARRQLEFKNRIKLYRMLYKNQFGIDNVDCSQAISKYMWSTGWGADFLNVIDGLGYGLTHGVPFVVNYNKRPWHYSRDVVECNEPGTINCYFLNYSKCNNNSTTTTNVNVVNETMLDSKKQFLKNNKYISDILYETNNRYIYEWITRPKTWLRKKVVDFIEPYLSKLPFKQCTVIHVRRGDVVLHGKVSRRYFEIHEYVSALEDYRSKSNVTTSTLTNNNETKTMIILLLTDDANAIMEAKTLYPNYTWITIDRSRYQGSEGGFEGHFPSNDALKETIVLLGTFQLVQRCTTLIHTHSNLAQLFYGYMLSEHGKKNLNRVEIGSNTNHTFDTKNIKTVNISRSEF